MEAPARNHRVHFGAFDADLRSGELYKNGIRVKLQEQPFQVLALLLEHPGEVVSREKLRQRLWPADTFVDFDTGLNSAIKKLRDALSDKAETPRYVETLPRRGYRLIVPVENTETPEYRNVRVATTLAANAAEMGEPALRTGGTGPGETVASTEEGEAARNVVALDLSPSPVGVKSTLNPWRKIGIVAAALAVLAFGTWWHVWQSEGAYTIAVLPFKNLSTETDSDYFSDGLTDEIITNLSVIDGLEVKSRTSSFFFKDRPAKVREVGEELGAKLVLEGSVLRSGDKLRINAQLVRASDDVPLWSNSFDRELKDIFAIQDEISRSIVNQLRLKLGSGQRRYNTNLEAYDLYLKARTLAENQALPEGRQQILTGISLFETVTTKDAGFAPAFAGLATAYGRLSVTPRSFSPDEAYTKMRAAAEEALRLDPLLPAAHASMGLVYARDHDWQDSEKAFRRSLELDPSLAESRRDFAMSVLFPLGRLDEAARELRKAIELDPLSTVLRDSLDHVLVSTGRYDEVLDDCPRILAQDPNDYAAEQLYARAMMQKGRLNEATAIFEKQDQDGTGSPGFLGYAYAKAGRRADAEKVAAKYPEWPWVHVFVYAGLGDKDRTFQALDEMVAIHDPRVGVYLTYPELSFLRGDPRVTELRQSLGMPPLL